MTEQAYQNFVLPYLEQYDYASEGFAEKYHYDDELGAIFSQEKTIFRVWSPVVKQIDILYFGQWVKDKMVSDTPAEIWPMTRDEKGVWEHEQPGNLEFGMYLYQVTYFSGEQKTCNDPYAKAVTINAKHTVILDLEKTNIETWKPYSSTAQGTDIIIYEASIRDFTSYPETDIQHKGKFVGIAESGRKNRKGQAVGLDYLEELGITHLQLMPFFDFATIDEEHPEAGYNWGYDPMNFQVPEGSYASQPDHPLNRIFELKKMIQALHDKNIAIIMDTVFNHVYQVETHPFTVLVPGYYFRHLENGKPANGTWCGNEVASERSMVRKYLLDTIEYWVKEFHIDGFRLDLMGILDYETVNLIKEKVDALQPSNIILGEGWNMGEALPEELRASSLNAKKMPGISFFNDRFRNAVRGNVFNLREKGFITGGGQDFDFLNVDSWKQNYVDASQMVQYVAAHDNYTLFDQISGAVPNQDFSFYARIQNLANSMVLLIPGIPFIHAGQEFMRSKYGEGNSYNLPDYINQINWDLIDRETVDYMKALIRFRKSHTLFRMSDFEEISRCIEFHFLSKQLLKMRIKGKREDFWCFFNAYDRDSYTLIDAANYEMSFEDNIEFSNKRNQKSFHEGGNTIEIRPYSTFVMRKI